MASWPFVGGPDGVYTGYTASETVPFMNFKANLDCCTKCAKPGCFCQPKPLRVNQNAASPEDASLVIVGSGYLQADVGSPFSSDATGRWSVAPPARAPQPPPTPPRR